MPALSDAHPAARKRRSESEGSGTSKEANPPTEGSDHRKKYAITVVSILPPASLLNSMSQASKQDYSVMPELPHIKEDGG